MQKSLKSQALTFLICLAPLVWLVFYLGLPWYFHLISLGVMGLGWVFWTQVFVSLSEKKGKKIARKTLLFLAAVAAAVLLLGVLLLILFPITT